MNIPSRIMAVLLIYLLSATAIAGTIPDKKSVVYSKTDSILAEQIISGLSPNSEGNPGTLVAQVGMKLLDTPYVAQTLENGKQERLIVNLRELDCTTFAENCLALALAVKSGKANFEQFIKELETIRYRQGRRMGYPSRLHYFSDWIYDNGQKGLITEPAAHIGSPLRVQVNFMSSHPDSYPVLKDHPELVPVLAEQEKTISDRHYFFLRKEEVYLNEDKLNEGDIVGLTTSIAGLDVAHVGILVKKNERIHLLHASSTSGKVVISEEPLSDMLMNKKSYTGIMIARPK
ncbi:MAG: N-acetylmuramoyl-L-alanine amidase-like domain-containing protein [Mangrovibacterium sp.]